MIKPVLFLFLLLSASCVSNQPENNDALRELHPEFGHYWYKGKAEIRTYSLHQQRYGEEVEGEAVMIFVTEDFSSSKLVKVDRSDENNGDQLKVMKLNALRDFETGVYPYHTMVSVFSPVYERQPALKITSSVLEWCGMAFTSLRIGSNWIYQMELHSYFEQEAGYTASLKGIPEDDLWVRLRLMKAPEDMPIGEVLLIPSLLRQRFTHREPAAEKAHLRWEKGMPESLLGLGFDELLIFAVDYVDSGASLRIYLEPHFPFKILAWEERASKQADFTRAVLKKDTLLDYWNYNQSEDQSLRYLLRGDL
jgi:hypothetical protein